MKISNYNILSSAMMGFKKPQNSQFTRDLKNFISMVISKIFIKKIDDFIYFTKIKLTTLVSLLWYHFYGMILVILQEWNA